MDKQSTTVMTRTRKQIGKRIKHARQLADLEQTDLARMLTEATGEAWTNRMVSNVELGHKKIDAEVIVVLADLLGRSEAWFYQFDPDYTGGGGGSRANRAMRK